MVVVVVVVGGGVGGGGGVVVVAVGGGGGVGLAGSKDDARARHGEHHEVVQRALPGLALLQPLGNLLEILVAVVSAIIVSQLLVRSRLLSSPPTQRPKTKMSGQTMRVIARR